MRFELSLVNGFIDSPAASRAKVRFPSSPFFFRSQGSPISFFLHPVCSSEHRVSHGLSMQPRCGRSCHCSGDRYLELAAPSKSYHTLSGISINAAALIARSSPYYRRAALRPRSYAALAEFIAIPLLLSPLQFAVPPRILEEEARTSGKPKSAIPITRTIYRPRDVLVSYI